MNFKVTAKALTWWITSEKNRGGLFPCLNEATAPMSRFICEKNKFTRNSPLIPKGLKPAAPPPPPALSQSEVEEEGAS